MGAVRCSPPSNLLILLSVACFPSFFASPLRAGFRSLDGTRVNQFTNRIRDRRRPYFSAVRALGEGLPSLIPLFKLKNDPKKVGTPEVSRFDLPSRFDSKLNSYVVDSPKKISLRGVIGSSSYARRMRKALVECEDDARNVLISGEDGLSKDMFACLIHFRHQSKHQKGPLLFFEAGQLPSQVDRLFGKEGSRELGVLECAGNGTLVINNVHSLPPELQREVGVLLRYGSFKSRVDGTYKTTKLRIIAITEKPIPGIETDKSSFLRIKIPSLRVRTADIRPLVRFQIRQQARLKGIPPPEVEESAFRRLERYEFPGNTRELFSMVERAIATLPEGSNRLTEEMFWQATNRNKLDAYRINLLDVFPAFRQFLLTDTFPERLNHNFTKYVYPVVVAALFIGPQTRDANAALNIFWAWWWPGILLLYPLIGRLWCSICPFMIYGEVMQRFRVARGAVLAKWPVKAMEMWGGWALFSMFFAILLWEEVWRLENTAYLSGWLLLIITAGAVLGSAFFERRLWCRYLCPIGGMNGMFAKLSLTEVRSSKGICDAECTTYHCYKGGPAEGEGQETLGCPLHSHPASLRDNKDCVGCMTCLKACPHRSVQVNLRAPGVDFGYPFLFPVPGTSSAPQHNPTASEVALLLLLLGAVFTHHLSGVLSQVGFSPGEIASIIEDKKAHSIAAAATLSVPGLTIFAVDSVMRLFRAFLYPSELPPNRFVSLAYSYLPLVWLASLSHYLLLGLTEAGRILPVGILNIAFFMPGDMTREWVEGLGKFMPTLTAPIDVVKFLQGSALLAGVGMSSLLLQKLGGQRRLGWVHLLTMIVLTAELWDLIV
ncbi:hypothetical protein AAMO2058_000224200 [Amorphochlora amoebiformis]